MILAYNSHTAEATQLLGMGPYAQRADEPAAAGADMYEHAYHMDYGAAAARYVDAFIQNVKWEEVNRRAEEALRKWA